MLPVFKPGEIAFVRPLGASQPCPGLFPGDCAVYLYEGRQLLHRVVKTVKDGAWLADDAGRLERHFVPWEDIRGKVLSRNPLAGGFCGYLYSGVRRCLSALLA